MKSPFYSWKNIKSPQDSKSNTKLGFSLTPTSTATLVLFSFIIIGALFGITNADNENSSNTKNFSAIGIVASSSESTILLENSHVTNTQGLNTLTLDVSNVSKIENTKYSPLNILDIKVGDKIAVQGIDKDGVIIVRRIIVFSDRKSEILNLESLVIATSTVSASSTAVVTPERNVIISSSTEDLGTTTIDIELVTSTDDIASTTPSDQILATSTDSTASTTLSDQTEQVSTSTPSTELSSTTVETQFSSSNQSQDNATSTVLEENNNQVDTDLGSISDPVEPVLPKDEEIITDTTTQP